MATFEIDGEAYRLAATHQREWGLSLIDTIPLRGDEGALDLGCGGGTGHQVSG